MLILEANDTIAPVQPKPGTQVLIPSQMLLPDVPREGIVVNLAELRLYFRRERIRCRSIRWALPVRSGNAGDDHPRGAEDP